MSSNEEIKRRSKRRRRGTKRIYTITERIEIKKLIWTRKEDGHLHMDVDTWILGH